MCVCFFLGVGLVFVVCVCVWWKAFCKSWFTSCSFWCLSLSWCRVLSCRSSEQTLFWELACCYLQMVIESFGWNMHMGLAAEWGQICYCKCESLAQQMLFRRFSFLSLPSDLLPVEAPLRFCQSIFVTYFWRYWRSVDLLNVKENFVFGVFWKCRLEAVHSCHAHIFSVVPVILW